MDPGVYFLIFPPALNRYHRRNIDNKSPMDRRVYFLIFPQVFHHDYAFKRYLTRNVENKSSSDLRVYFLLSLQLLITRRAGDSPREE